MNDFETSLVAKPIIADQYWIITDGTNKVGNVIADNSGFNLTLNGVVRHNANTDDIMREFSIDFQNQVGSEIKNHSIMPDWPTTGKTYNSLLDVKNKLHLYTKTQDSKCYYAAGWFNMKIDNKWQSVFCPKYILIQRYSWNGPFHSQSEASNAILDEKGINTT